MFVVLGASGHTGRVVAEKLLAAGKKVRVVGRGADHLRSLAAAGAEIAVTNASDAPALTKVFKGVEGAYVLIPPDPSSSDYRGSQDRLSDAIAAAVQNAGVKNVVSLSSIGADKASGTGPVVGLHNLEQKLNAIDGVNVLHLRAGYFMANTLPQVSVIRMMGSLAGPLRPSLKVQMIATQDIGAAAAEGLLSGNIRGKQTRELQGQRDLDYVEVASIIGKAIGKPGLGYVQAPDEQLKASMVKMGMSANFVELLLEMTGAMNSGHMKALEARSAANTTPTAYETFVQEEFVPAYREQTAAA